jgi:probable HAF family extracellular repeat protein
MQLSFTRVALTGLLACLVALPASANRYRIVDLGETGDNLAVNDLRTVAGSIEGAQSGVAAVFRKGAWHTLKGDAYSSEALAINDFGQVVGREGPSPVMWLPHGGMIYLSMPHPGDTGQPRAISNTSLVAGWYRHPDQGAFGCFLWKPDGHSIALGGEDFPYCMAFGVNEVGEVVGEGSFTPEAPHHAFLWKEGRMRDLGTLGSGPDSTALGINALGDVVGVSTFNGAYTDWHAFLWHDGKMIDLNGSPDYRESAAHAINLRGEIIGNATRGHFGNQAVRFDDGRIVMLETEVEDLEDWYLWEALDINDRGDIVGIGNHALGRHAYLLVRLD